MLGGGGGGGEYIAHPSYCPSFVDFILRPIIAACVYIYMYILRVRVVGERRGVKIREMWERYDISFFLFSFFKDLVSSANYYIDVYIYIYIYEITKM